MGTSIRSPLSNGSPLSSSAPQRIGDYLLQYELEARPGERRFLATHVVLPRRAMIVLATAADLAPRVLRTAYILEAMQVGVPRVFECGVAPGAPGAGDRCAWIALEIVEGATAAERTTGHAMTVVDLVTLVRDVADILADAHERGIVHANLTARSIVFRQDLDLARTTVCLVEWSGAQLHDSRPSPKLHAACASRDRIYLAPELAAGQRIDNKVDVYALGVVAHQALSRVVTASAADRAVIDMLDELVENMLEDEPADRPTAVAVGDAAAAILDRAEQALLARDSAQFDAVAAVDDSDTDIDVVEVDLLELAELVEVPAVSPPNRRIVWTPGSAYEPTHTAMKSFSAPRPLAPASDASPRDNRTGDN